MTECRDTEYSDMTEHMITSFIYLLGNVTDNENKMITYLPDRIRTGNREYSANPQTFKSRSCQEIQKYKYIEHYTLGRPVVTHASQTWTHEIDLKISGRDESYLPINVA